MLPGFCFGSVFCVDDEESPFTGLLCVMCYVHLINFVRLVLHVLWAGVNPKGSG